MNSKNRRVKTSTPRGLSYEKARQILIDADDEFANILKRGYYCIFASPIKDFLQSAFREAKE